MLDELNPLIRPNHVFEDPITTAVIFILTLAGSMVILDAPVVLKIAPVSVYNGGNAVFSKYVAAVSVLPYWASD